MKKVWSIFLIILVIPFGFASAQTNSTFDFMDVFELQYASQPQISPDASQIVYHRVKFDVQSDRRYTNLWIINRDGSGHQPLTSGKDGYRSARWSPDGTRLAYISGEEGKSQLFVRWMDNGRTSSITNEMNTPGTPVWSPDGNWIAYTMFVPTKKTSSGNFPSAPAGADWEKNAIVIDQFDFKSDGNPNFLQQGSTHIFVVSAEGGAARQITSGDYDHRQPVWAPDGQSIIFTANRSENPNLNGLRTHIFEVNVASGEIRQITDGPGPNSNPTISPDGKTIAFMGYLDKKEAFRYNKLWVINRDGSGRKEISTDLKGELGSAEFSQDGKYLFVYYEHEGSGKLAQVNINGRAKDVAENIGGESWGRPYSGGSFSISDKGYFAFTLSTTDRPAEVAVGAVSGRSGINKLTALNEAFFANKTMGKVETQWWKSSHDGWDVQGWSILPPNFDPSQKYPLILEIHGGPYAAYGPHFTPELQLMAAKGYVVLYTNPRGSTTYSEEFAMYINHNYPSEDYDDLMSGVDHMISKGFIDTNNLFITGGSGGGVLTSWSIGKTDRFKAAVVSKPVINWFSFGLTADGKSTYTQYWFPKFPWEDPMDYFNRSPISLVGNVKTPAMIVTGENDFRTPMPESEQYYNALQLRGIESMLVRIQGAGHGLTARPSNMIRHVGYITSWFDKYKK